VPPLLDDEETEVPNDEDQAQVSHLLQQPQSHQQQQHAHDPANELPPTPAPAATHLGAAHAAVADESAALQNPQPEQPVLTNALWPPGGSHPAATLYVWQPHGKPPCDEPWGAGKLS
jgi:hypothetical protein